MPVLLRTVGRDFRSDPVTRSLLGQMPFDVIARDRFGQRDRVDQRIGLDMGRLLNTFPR